ncbi:MAG: DUF3800 domain-containing protein [Armatimonadetes bacterium]|nr:DUF3800 domain-containing protein [Armatimonadota bacterium]
MSDLSKGLGDSDGRRLARRHASATEEACRVAECLATLMRRCNLSDADANRIATNLRIRAVELREKAEGRIESRLTTKNTGHPLLEDRNVNSLYLDESGTSAINADDQVFALGGVAMHDEDVNTYIAEADKIKRQFFCRTDITFHEPDMRRHNDDFSFRRNRTRQAEFDRAFRALVERTPFTVFGVGIRKDAFKQEFLDSGCDPYLPTRVYDLAIMLMLERYVDYLATHQQRRIGRVHLESIGAREDAEHQAAYADLLLHGTQFVPEKTFQSWVEAGYRFSPKRGSSPAEMSDLVAREVFEWTRGGCQNDPPYWAVLNPKIHRRADGHFGKFGVKVFPSSDIDEAVMAHRVLCGAAPKN